MKRSICLVLLLAVSLVLIGCRAPDAPPTSEADAYPLPADTIDPYPAYPAIILPENTNIPDAYPGDSVPQTAIPAYPGEKDTPEAVPTETLPAYPGETPQPTPLPTTILDTPLPTTEILQDQPITLSLVISTTYLLTSTVMEQPVTVNGAVGQVTWSPDQESLAAAAPEGINFFSTDDLEYTHWIETPARALSLEYLPNSNMLAAGGLDSVVHWWDGDTGIFLGDMRGHFLGVTALDTNPFGNLLASGSDDGTVNVWNTSSIAIYGVDFSTNTFTFHDPVTRVTSIALNPTGQILAAGSYRTIHFWNTAKGELLHTLEIPTDWTPSMQFSPDNRQFAFVLPDGAITFYDVGTWEKLFHVPTFPERPTVLSYTPNGNLLAVGTKSGRIIIMGPPSSTTEETGKLIAWYLLEGHSGEITGIAFNRSGTALASSSTDGSIRLWNLSP